MRSYIFLLFCFCFLAIARAASPSPADPKTAYYKALAELAAMLESQQPASFKRAVFVAENAYHNDSLDYATFCQKINDLANFANVVASQTPLTYPHKDSNHIRLNAGISRLFFDTLHLQYQSQTLELMPFGYHFQDFLGQQDWTNTFVTRSLETGLGNCRSLPYLYKILADELQTPAYLALAPNHIYLKHPSKNPDLLWYNTELTNRTHPSDGWIMAAGYINTQMIQRGLYMDTLSQAQSIALCVLDLSNNFKQQFPNDKSDFVAQCVGLVLRHFPHCVPAHIQKIEYAHNLYQTKPSKQKLAQLTALCQQLHDLGYRQMPRIMYQDWLNTSDKFSRHTQPFAAQHQQGDKTVLSLSKGRYLELFDQADTIQIANLSYSISNNKIVDLAADNLVSPAIHSRFFSVDPIAAQYPELTPYQFASNTPIQAIDLDGLEAWYVNKQFENKQFGINRHVNAGWEVSSYGPYSLEHAAEKGFLSGDCHIPVEITIQHGARGRDAATEGGKMGGHVAWDLNDGLIYGFTNKKSTRTWTSHNDSKPHWFTDAYKVPSVLGYNHIFPSKEHPNSIYDIKTEEEWYSTKPAHRRLKTNFKLTISIDQYFELRNTYYSESLVKHSTLELSGKYRAPFTVSSHAKEPPYDYAVFGKRCASSLVYEGEKLGIFKDGHKLKSFTPGKLIRSLEKAGYESYQPIENYFNSKKIHYNKSGQNVKR